MRLLPPLAAFQSLDPNRQGLCLLNRPNIVLTISTLTITITITTVSTPTNMDPSSSSLPQKYTWAYELQCLRQHFHLVHFLILIGMPLTASLCIPQTPLHRNTLLMGVFAHIMGILGISVGT